jgi:small subunit ribosomal protein S20
LAKGDSVKKAARQSETHRIRNRVVRQARESASDDNGETADATVKSAIAQLDKARSKNLLHRNNVARKKSRLMKRLNSTD